MLIFWDYLLLIFHTAFVLLAVSGWAFPRLRRLHAVILVLTLVAWLGIGWYKGVIGYCPLTDIHWDIKREMGQSGMPSSFMEYLFELIIPVDFDSTSVDIVTGVGMGLSVLASIFVNWPRKKRSHGILS